MLAIGQIHRIGAGAARGDLAAVIESVGADLFASAPARLQLDLDAESVIVPAPQAALVALIVNELATNALKHGLRDGTAAGTVTIGFRRTGATSVALWVADDGVPLPANVGDGQPHGLGLDLVRRLAGQLAGELVVDQPAKRFTINFPVGSPGLS